MKQEIHITLQFDLATGKASRCVLVPLVMLSSQDYTRKALSIQHKSKVYEEKNPQN
jgi:hypothetical protein